MNELILIIIIIKITNWMEKGESRKKNQLQLYGIDRFKIASVNSRYI